MTRKETTAMKERTAAPEGPQGEEGFEKLLHKIRSRDARVAVMGLGYVGLPLVKLFAAKGFRVIACDVDHAKIEQLNRGRSYIKSVPSADIARHLANKLLLATSDFRNLASADAIFVCVPTPLTSEGKPDVSAIRQTAKSIGATLRKGQVVILESTSYPGTTREVMKPELERRGMRCGTDFFLAFSPEREDPGNKDFSMERIPKIVGGIDARSLRAAAALYGEVVARVVEVSSCETAEAAKLLENIYRCVNIALVNELKMCYDRMNIDVWEVIRAAATKPFGFQAFYPGPGLGGHCIPIDPFYLSWKAREYQFSTRFIDLAGEINTQMPYYVLAKLEEGLRAQGKKLEGARVLMLGLAYKKDIDDPRESPAFKLLELLDQKGASVVCNDPNIQKYASVGHAKDIKVTSVPVTSELLASVDAALIVTNHSDYDYGMIAQHAPLIVDTRNACADQTRWRGKIVRA